MISQLLAFGLRSAASKLGTF